MIVLVSLANATSCGPNVVVVPPQGAAGLAVNVRPYVSNDGKYSEPDPVLTDASGAVVPTVRAGKRLIPVTPLEPDSAYVVGSTYNVAEFTTGSHTDLDAPSAPTLVDHGWSSISNWEHGEWLRFAAPSEISVLELALTVVATGQTYGPAEVASPFIGTIVCGSGFGPGFPDPHTEVHLTARWVDLAGNLSEPLEVDIVLGEDEPLPDTGPTDTGPTDTDPIDPTPPVPPDPARACGCGPGPGVPGPLVALLALVPLRRRATQNTV